MFDLTWTPSGFARGSTLTLSYRRLLRKQWNIKAALLAFFSVTLSTGTITGNLPEHPTLEGRSQHTSAQPEPAHDQHHQERDSVAINEELSSGNHGSCSIARPQEVFLVASVESSMAVGAVALANFFWATFLSFSGVAPER